MTAPIDRPDAPTAPRVQPPHRQVPSCLHPTAPVADDIEVTTLANPDASDTVVVTARHRPVPSGQPGGPQGQEPAGPAGLDLLGEIGAGAMGQVLLAKDPVLRRNVAYKRLHRDLGSDPEMLQRLLTEAQITAQLDHPNVVPLHTLEQQDTRPVGYVMKLVQGETLTALIAQARAAVVAGLPLPAGLGRETLLDHFLKVCDAVAFAHAKGVIHRDLKPDNIMVGRFNEVYVMDWGIARVLHRPELLPAGPEAPVQCARDTAGTAAGATDWGTLLGTPKYMSPEQARGEIDRLDPRSDLYSLGLILYELVCLRPAFGGSEFDRILERVRRGQGAPIKAPSARLPVPRELQAIIGKATAAIPADRYPDVAALANDLRGFLRGEPVSALRDTLLRRTLRWIGRHRQGALSLFLATLLIAGLATGTLWYRQTTAMQQVQQRRALTMHYLDLASAQAQGIIQHFLSILGQLEGLSVGAELALEHGQPTPVELYTNDDFANPAAAPRDLAPSPHYGGGPISVEHPAVILPRGGMTPGMDRGIRQLLALKTLFQRIFLEAHGQREVPASGPKVREVLDRQDLRINWIGVALQDGAMVGYPGYGGFPADYDPTGRPWYRQALPAGGRKVCGDPYLAAVSQALIMSCSVALYSDAGEFFGVAEVDLPLADSVAKLLVTRELPLARALLLNRDGRILVEARVEAGANGAEARTLISERLRPYEDERLVTAVRAGRSGLLEPVDGDRRLWLIYIDLPELTWTYVAELDADLGQPRPAGAGPGVSQPAESRPSPR